MQFIIRQKMVQFRPVSRKNNFPAAEIFIKFDRINSFYKRADFERKKKQVGIPNNISHSLMRNNSIEFYIFRQSFWPVTNRSN